MLSESKADSTASAIDEGGDDRSIACHRFDDSYADHLADAPETVPEQR